MDAIEQTARAAARRAYERGRLGASLRTSWLAAPLLGVGLWRSGPLPWAILCGLGAALFGVLTFCAWRGRALERALIPGLVGGAVLLLLPALAPAGRCLELGGCSVSVCTALCPAAGLVAGFAIGSLTSRQEAPRLPFFLASCAVAALTGALGCAWIGAGGAIGMIGGALAGGLPAYALVTRRAFRA